MFSFLKDSRATVKAAIIIGSFPLIGILFKYFFDSKIEIQPIVTISQDGSTNSTQNINQGNGIMYVDQIDKLEKYRELGKNEGLKEGYAQGFNDFNASIGNVGVPDDVINKMFPIIRGESYLQRKEKAKKICVDGSLANKEICSYKIVKTGRYKKEVTKSVKELEAEEKSRQEAAKNGMGFLKINLRFATEPNPNGEISTEEAILRKAEHWFLICSYERGCDLVDFNGSLPFYVDRMKADEYVIKGIPVKKSELFDDYRLRNTSVFLNRQIRPFSLIEIKLLKLRAIARDKNT
jgi:hypothetical protein